MILLSNASIMFTLLLGATEFTSVLLTNAQNIRDQLQDRQYG
jgi:hypothetical protein